MRCAWIDALLGRWPELEERGIQIDSEDSELWLSLRNGERSSRQKDLKQDQAHTSCDKHRLSTCRGRKASELWLNPETVPSGIAELWIAFSKFVWLMNLGR